MRKSSFSIVRDEDSDDSNKSFDEDLVPLDKKSATKQFNYLDKLEGVKIDDDSDVDSKKRPTTRSSRRLSAGKDFPIPPSASVRKSALTKVIKKNSSGSEDDETRIDDIDKSIKVPNEYNPILYQDLDVDDEVRELFQYITKYMPQQLTLDYKFKPFIPDYLPAVGDIDAFLKVVPPEPVLLGEDFNIQQEQKLGISVLDEPATIQSDSALLHLQLRAANLGVPQDTSNVIVKKVDNVEKNHKVIDKWIKDISDLHKSKSSPFVRYSEPMPDIDDLMQEWPEEMEHRLKEHGFPAPESNMSLTEYLELICDMFQIPTTKNKVHSLHVLFSLYAAVKDSKFYKSSKNDNNSEILEVETDQPDQLVLD